MLHTLPITAWNTQCPDSIQENAIQQLENGQVLHLPQLAFDLLETEKQFLTPDYADPQAKNISYHVKQHKLWGVKQLTDEQHLQLKHMLERYSRFATQLVQCVLPHYTPHLMIARTSYRPVQVSNRKTSYRKDDKRLHVDAFPSAPNQGKRILRVFCNINPHQEDRVWRLGEPFEQVAKKFLPQIRAPFPGSASLLRCLRITKSYRTLYDHYMLQMHNRMKADNHYQTHAPQQEVRFPSGCSWIVQTDDVSHAAMQGQYLLEQTFYLPVAAMQNPAQSPLHILERLLNKKLI